MVIWHLVPPSHWMWGMVIHHLLHQPHWREDGDMAPGPSISLEGGWRYPTCSTNLIGGRMVIPHLLHQPHWWKDGDIAPGPSISLDGGMVIHHLIHQPHWIGGDGTSLHNTPWRDRVMPHILYSKPCNSRVFDNII